MSHIMLSGHPIKLIDFNGLPPVEIKHIPSLLGESWHSRVGQDYDETT